MLANLGRRTNTFSWCSGSVPLQCTGKRRPVHLVFRLSRYLYLHLGHRLLPLPTSIGEHAVIFVALCASHSQRSCLHISKSAQNFVDASSVSSAPQSLQPLQSFQAVHSPPAGSAPPTLNPSLPAVGDISPTLCPRGGSQSWPKLPHRSNIGGLIDLQRTKAHRILAAPLQRFLSSATMACTSGRTAHYATHCHRHTPCHSREYSSIFGFPLPY